MKLKKLILSSAMLVALSLSASINAEDKATINNTTPMQMVNQPAGPTKMMEQTVAPTVPTPPKMPMMM